MTTFVYQQSGWILFTLLLIGVFTDGWTDYIAFFLMLVVGMAFFVPSHFVDKHRKPWLKRLGVKEREEN